MEVISDRKLGWQPKPLFIDWSSLYNPPPQPGNLSLRQHLERRDLTKRQVFVPLYEKCHFLPSRVFDLDETCIIIVSIKASNTISFNGKKQLWTLASAERVALVTAEIYVNTAGKYIPSLPIFTRTNMNRLKTLFHAIHHGRCSVRNVCTHIIQSF